MSDSLIDVHYAQEKNRLLRMGQRKAMGEKLCLEHSQILTDDHKLSCSLQDFDIVKIIQIMFSQSLIRDFCIFLKYFDIFDDFPKI